VTRILVVDDSETILLLLEKRLQLAGYEVSTAADGEQALEAMRAGPAPDLILLDAMMPRKSGIETLREIRDAGDDTPVLMVSAHRGVEELREAERVGANGFVTKPIDWDELLAKIQALAA
jgi:two-component system, OmpR family, response regulator MprA